MLYCGHRKRKEVILIEGIQSISEKRAPVSLPDPGPADIPIPSARRRTEVR